MDAHEMREDAEHWQHERRQFEQEMAGRMGWWNPRGWGNKQPTHTHSNVHSSSHAASSVGHGSSARRSRTTAHRDPSSGDTVIETRNGTRIEISGGGSKKHRGSKRRSSRHRDSSRDAHRLDKYRSVHGDFAGHYKKPWGHPEHRCRPAHFGIFSLICGFIIFNKRMREKGKQEREMVKRERRKERRRRWALFKAEVRAHKSGHKTPYTI